MYRVIHESKEVLFDKNSFDEIFQYCKKAFTVHELGQLTSMRYDFEDFEILTHLGLFKFYYWLY